MKKASFTTSLSPTFTLILTSHAFKSRELRAQSQEMEKSKGIKFRFENLDIWQRACQIATKLFRIADMLEEKKLYRFADQLRGAGLSMPNNPVK